MLHLSSGSATSMHCHARKRTSLIVMSGAVECSTFDERHQLQAGEGVVLEPCVFHSTLAVSEGGAFVMEIETPPLKGDLLRYRDNFGRAGKAYEDQQQYATDFSDFFYHPLENFSHSGKPFDFLDVKIQLRQFNCPQDFASGLMDGGLVVPFLGRIEFGCKLLADIGEALPTCEIPHVSCPPDVPMVELLQICRKTH